MAEAALAHAAGDQVELSYRWGDALKKRRKMMDAWAAYCDPAGRGDNVVNINRKVRSGR